MGPHECCMNVDGNYGPGDEEVGPVCLSGVCLHIQCAATCEKTALKDII